jgi:hypothetical protein
LTKLGVTGVGLGAATPRKADSVESKGQGKGVPVVLGPSLKGDSKAQLVDSSQDDKSDGVKLPTTKSLARDRELNKLLNSYNCVDSSVLSALVSSASGVSRGGDSPKLKKHLAIPDYLSR